MLFYPADISHFHSFGCHSVSHLGSLRQTCDPDRRGQNSHKSHLWFLPIRHFPCAFLCLSLVAQLGSLLQKSDPGKCIQHSNKNCLCCYAHQTFYIFIPLAVPWGPNWDPCCKSVILTGAHKNHIKIVYVFSPTRHFPFPFLWLPLGIPTWAPCCKSVILAGARKIHITIVSYFLPIRHFPFSFLCLSLGVPTWILAAKVCA